MEAPASRAFPGWTAAESHRALNDTTESPTTTADVHRVGRLMGEAAGS
ncbi:MAG: hypothetical protein OXH70_16205 [Acidobacteria bacterium]|nr:hypothetical protein [Acidobacteriota bacterium]